MSSEFVLLLQEIDLNDNLIHSIFLMADIKIITKIKQYSSSRFLDSPSGRYELRYFVWDLHYELYDTQLGTKKLLDCDVMCGATNVVWDLQERWFLFLHDQTDFTIVNVETLEFKSIGTFPQQFGRFFTHKLFLSPSGKSLIVARNSLYFFSITYTKGEPSIKPSSLLPKFDDIFEQGFGGIDETIRRSSISWYPDRHKFMFAVSILGTPLYVKRIYSL